MVVHHNIVPQVIRAIPALVELWVSQQILKLVVRVTNATVVYVRKLYNCLFIYCFLGVDAHAARREFLSYCLSLMRAHNSEHLDSLPVLDVSAMKHVAYVFDALIYFMRSGQADSIYSDVKKDGFSLAWSDPVCLVPFINYKCVKSDLLQDENENDETEDDIAVAMDTESLDDQEVSNLANISNSLNSSTIQGGTGKGRKHSFFQRSESTLCLGCPPPDPFETPMAEALPLADQPHLLQPNARREDLFGIPKQPITLTSSGGNSNNPLESLPTKLSLSSRTSDFGMSHPVKANQPISSSLNVMGPNPLIYPQNYTPDVEKKGNNIKEVEVQTDEILPSTSTDVKQATNVNKTSELWSRPQIIVSPRKTDAADESTVFNNVNNFVPMDCTQEIGNQSTTSTSRSPSKSVIVRAGSSTVSY